MSEYYEVTSFKPSDFKDNYGNTWCDMALLKFGEPVKIVLKDPSTVKVGDKLYGTINTQTSKAGKEYFKFKKEMPQESPAGQPQSDEYWDDRNAAIRAQWAIGQAMNLAVKLYDKETGRLPFDTVEEYAEYLFAMVDRVSGKEASNDATVGRAVSDMVNSGADIDLDEVPY